MSMPGDTRPLAAFEWRLAARYMRPRRSEGFISATAGLCIAGILIGVAALIAVISVMNGFRTELLKKSLGFNGHGVAMKIGEPMTDYDAIAARLATVPQVKAVAPLVEGQVLLSHERGGFAYVRGMNEKSLKDIPIVANNIIFGSLDGFDQQTGIAIGIGIANNLGLKVGDSLSLVTNRGSTTPFGTAPRVKPFRIAIIFELGMAEYDKSVIFMPLTEAQRFFSKRDQVDLIEILVTDPDHINVAALSQAAGPDIQVFDWRQRNQVYATMLAVERNVMFIILSLIVLVAMFNIISVLLMMVKEKGRDIAVLRTMGATSGAIMRVFILTGAMIGAVGAVLGLIAGLLLCWNIDYIRKGLSWLLGINLYDPSIYMLSKMRADIVPAEVAFIVISAFILAVLATLYPSWRASRLDPVEALRYE